MTERHKALGAIFACVLFWGFSFISIKVAIAVFPPMTLGLFRFVLALVFLFFIKRGFAPKQTLKLRDVPLLFGAGITGVTLYFFCENNGVALVTASEASIITGAIPVLTMAVEWAGAKLFRRPSGSSPPERLGGRRWLGAVISMAGVWLVAGAALAVSGSLRGYLYMGGAALSWVAYCFLTRPLFARQNGRAGDFAKDSGLSQNPVTAGLRSARSGRIYIVFWQSVFGALGFLPFAIAEYPQWGRPDIPVLLHLIFLGIFCSALGYWFYAHSLEVLGVSVSSVFINFIPVVTVSGGFFLLGERLSPLQWFGAILVLTGVYLTMGEPEEIQKTSC
jgi:drug/metabolite transporter (DMT)-like permease